VSLRAAAAVLSVGLPSAPVAPSNGALPRAAAASALSHQATSIAPVLPAALPAALASLPAPAAPAAAAEPAARAPRAAAQLQAAQPPAKRGPTAEERAFYDRVFNGSKPAEGAEEAPAVEAGPAAAPAPEDPTLPALKRDTRALLEHLAATRTSWRSKQGIGEALARRALEVYQAGGIPRRVPDGWFGSRVEVRPLDRDLLAQIPGLIGAVKRIAASDRLDYSELLYSFNVLAGRAASRRAFSADIAWLYGTYRLGG
jgi:hypothetical protein